MLQLKQLFAVMTVASMMTLTACSSNPKEEAGEGSGSESSSETAGENAGAGEKGQGGAGEGSEGGVEVIGAGEGVGTEGQELKDEELGEGSTIEEAMKTFQPVVYFGYDQFQIDDESLETVKHYAAILVDNPQETIRLIGHTDERGSPEYNLALGERRAKAVEEAFMLYGVAQDRIEVISMGEEQPAVDESNEAAWEKNRRVVIEIQQ